MPYETIENTSIKEDRKIDIYNLHREAQLYPSLVGKWGERFAEAKDEKRRVDRKLELRKAEIEAEVRKNPQGYGWEESKSPTEKFINSAVILQDEYEEVFEETLQAQKNIDLLSSAVNEMAAKRSSIKYEVELFLAGYYSDLNIPKEFEKEIVKKGTDSQRKKIKTRSKGGK